MDERTILILCEKPHAAARISSALDEHGNPTKKAFKGIPYYEAHAEGKTILTVSALGHLYALTPKNKDRRSYPVFNFQWLPKYRMEGKTGNIKLWIEAISRLSERAQEYILATDYDVEGAVIGYNILRYACGRKEREAQRMKFSTLTPEELKRSYDSLQPQIEFSVIESGLCRHFLDALFGINLSRALTIAARRSKGSRITLSTGRVQGPILCFLAEREKEIKAFTSRPYWNVKLKFKKNQSVFEAEYQCNPVKNLNEAISVVKSCLGKIGKIIEVEEKQYSKPPPMPLNFGLLQAEAYHHFKYSLRKTADIAERLYLGALISYPRTSSQRLPPSINYAAIIEALGYDHIYQKYATFLLSKKPLIPREGKNTDPAHPSIFPTGHLPKEALSPPERKIYDLIVRRFMATFCDPVLKRKIRAHIEVSNYLFSFEGQQVLDEGWLYLCKPFHGISNSALPCFKKGQQIEILDVIREDKFTAPPVRYNQGSLLRKMEEEGLGTKSTRTNIIDTIYKRGYISGGRIIATDLGIAVADILHTYCQEAVSVEFTRNIENWMENIQKGVMTKDEVIQKVISMLRCTCNKFKRKEKIINRYLAQHLNRNPRRK